MIKTKEAILTIRLQPDKKKAIAKAAEESNRSMSDYIRLVMCQAAVNKVKV